MRRVFTYLSIVMLFAFASGFINISSTKNKETLSFKIDTLATNLTVPWQITFLPDRSMLFTERPGKVRLYKNGKLQEKPVFVVNDIKAESKTGLLGMVIHPDFTKNHLIYIAHNYGENNGLWLRVVRYEYKNDTLINPQTLIQGIPAARNHTGCRIVFGPDKKLYITTGDADQPIRAQDLKTYNGKILRLNDDGSIPVDNPFVKNDTAHKEIWSYGHRNPQGLAFQPGTNKLYETEHGPTGGDEVNIIEKGANYGWPVIHHQDVKAGMKSPIFEYTPSIGPSEALFYTGKAFPSLQGNLLVGCLRGESILRIPLDKPNDQEVFLKKQFGRIRSVVVGPDGFIYISTSNFDMPESKGERPYDMILRLRPSTDRTVITASERITSNNKSDLAKNNPQNMFKQLCASCHGDKLQGTEVVRSLIGGKFNYGADKKSIIKTITNGVVAKGMPAWNGAISKKDIEGLADYILTVTK
ncbi:PQQ-dependent sugar dehydrogenase [Pedobacter fastidiosus]|uniref:PQQ-dependent sugar dehydrogenase n=1 Tax=Pedobacter fastidiosus TaxID=2765361 RepID=A0ABR7KXP5_9SPHI|nr:PQQ-dependent sugar dehydrogenase [Pedobacter fastidiosus]MBC6112580.1 PQQ-dependent sugar dehydrogenase [Pedobacter fastidiosus]